MRFYKFWSRAVAKAVDPSGEEVFRSSTGYSNVSVEDAFRMAEERAKKNVRYWEAPAKFDNGYYVTNSERPIREETIEQFAENEETYAVISRNSYGCLVLNTTDVFFADIDKPVPKFRLALFSWIAGLFGNKPVDEMDFESRLIKNIERLVQTDSQMRLRVYRTLLGYRVVLTNQTVLASESKSIQLLKDLGSDKLYVSLCRSQDCYRARLTPKAWRGVAVSINHSFVFRFHHRKSNSSIVGGKNAMRPLRQNSRLARWSENLGQSKSIHEYRLF